MSTHIKPQIIDFLHSTPSSLHPPPTIPFPHNYFSDRTKRASQLQNTGFLITSNAVQVLCSKSVIKHNRIQCVAQYSASTGKQNSSPLSFLFLLRRKQPQSPLCFCHSCSVSVRFPYRRLLGLLGLFKCGHGIFNVSNE